MSALNVAGVDHVVLRVRDVPKILAFYEEVLGCKVERHAPKAGLWQLRAGASLLDIVSLDGSIGQRGGPAPGRDGRNLDHICLAVRPFNEKALRAHLAKHDVEIEGSSTDNYGAEGSSPSLYISDPEGNGIELMGPGAGDINRN